MSVDPYHAVQNDIQTSLQAATQLRASYLRIRGMARDDSEELIWARNELKATLATLEADLEDLEESVKVVESADARLFGLDHNEVQGRRKYVSHVRREIEGMRQELNNESHPGPSSPSNNNLSYPPNQADDDHQAEWARHEQQLLIHEQDRTIDSIAGTLSTIAQQASLMGQEIGEHHELLHDLEDGVDRTDSKLSNAMLRMKKLLRETEQKKSGWCIVLLIVVLIGLLLAVILV